MKEGARAQRKEWLKMAIDPIILETEVMKLSIAARARLAEKLILSLDAPSEEENLHLWVDEAERRLRDLHEGKAKEVSAEDALRRARAVIS
jgi:putative addiction module component (TIGR02574 family)